MCKYYSLARPVCPGGYPNSSNVRSIVNFDDRKWCEDIKRFAWGYIEYEEPLSEKDAEDYELFSANMRTFWGVEAIVDPAGTVLSAKVTQKVEALKMPGREEKRKGGNDYYLEWFASKSEAYEFINGMI